MPTALVTGATGLVGSHIVEQLRDAGWNVRAMLRQPTAVRQAGGWDPAAWLRGHDVEAVPGDILDLPSFVEAARACDTIFHTAAAVTPPASRIHPYDAYRVPNVDGTRNAIAAATRSGARLLQLSSVAVYGPSARYASSKATGVDETMPLDPLPERAYYARSKRESEELVMSAHAEGRIWATAVRPDVIYGPRDRQFVPRVAKLLRMRVAPLIGGGRAVMAIVHAAHVADGAIRAATNDAAGGSVYNLANDFDVTWREFYRLAGVGLEQTVRLMNVPLWIAQTGLRVTKRIVKLVTAGGMNVVTTASIDFMTRDNPFSSERARRELGWNPQLRPDTSIPEAFRWWKEHGR
ncbi:MAG TPA: NAD-dependent epimerase/dehydratase family protein [Gemmatimonadaceae bacterium]|nr:NAD-dependent epimerase/dehydratase family protein [Gemmatimonadaceae bacterium]